MTAEHKTTASRYRSLTTDREPYLDRARQAARLTIPSLVPPENSTAHRRFEQPFQALGARGVNNLSSKLLLTLLPPNSPFFRLTIDDATLEQMIGQEGLRAEIEEALSKIERTILTEIETQSIRVSAFEALKQLVVAGNALLYLAPEGGLKVYRLDRYVIRRDPMGTVLEIITHETVAFSALPPALQKRLDDGVKKDRQPLDLYTHIRLDGKVWKIHQEIKDKIVPGSEGTYPRDKCPWIPLRFSKIDGEHYGRGYVEEYIGDLRGLEALSKAIIEGTAISAKVLFLVEPTGQTEARTIAKAPNGAVRSGKASDVTVLRVDKSNDFRVAHETIDKLEHRLSYAFLLNAAVQRGGDRVTAEEIRYMASELEDALGGVYSILSQEFQLPLVTCLQHHLTRKRKLPALPKGMIRPAITTGLDALGRGHDLTKLDVFIGGMLQTLGPEGVRYLHIDDYLKRRATSIGIDPRGLIKTAEDIQQEMAAQMEAATGQIEGEDPGA